MWRRYTEEAWCAWGAWALGPEPEPEPEPEPGAGCMCACACACAWGAPGGRDGAAGLWGEDGMGLAICVVYNDDGDGDDFREIRNKWDGWING